ncbi:hypothetical protein M422DRAFT_63921 [Sphaerobolus stellatus SS14]|nr:hypothetical protein M422DRAFT_63921 [Sphaerobolus stellatus SS14]
MTSPIPSPKRPERKESHPYPIKTTSTGILARSNSSRPHNSLSRHRYVPSSPSASMIFDVPQGSPSPTRRSTPLPKVTPRKSPSNKSQVAESIGSNSPSPSKYSKTWVAYNAGGEEIQLPRHPYLWTPAQLVTCLTSILRNSEGEPLEEGEGEPILSFIQDQQIGGRAFLALDEEDFQELEGLDLPSRNALWDAACTVRQQALPYRASRVSSTSYKRGRVKGMVGVFERSASESSDAGEDSRSLGLSSTPKRQNGINHEPNHEPPHELNEVPSTHNQATRRQNGFWDMSESEDDAEKIVWGFGRQGKPPHRSTPYVHAQQPFDSEVEEEKVGIPNGHNGQLHVVSAQDDTAKPVDAVIAPPPSEQGFDSPYPTDAQDTELPEDDTETPHNSRREIDIASIPPQHDEEPTMAELYEQTYGEPAPSSRTVPVEVPHTGDTTLHIPLPALPDPEAEDSSQPPTVLRPVRAREISDQTAQSSPPPALRDIFIAEPPEQLRSIFLIPPVNEARPPEPASKPPQPELQPMALETITTLRARLEIVEKKLADIELFESERATTQQFQQFEPTAEVRIREELQAAAVVPITPIPRRRRRKSQRQQYTDDLDDLDKEFQERSALSKPMRVVHDMIYGDDEDNGDFRTAMRSWHSKYILLAGATTGVSIVLIPMLLRHLWTR